jgi:adenylate kinase family enzyme
MNRVAVIGSGGAGKSTLARRLGDLTGLPVYHLDCLMWKPGWVMRDNDEEDVILSEVAQRPRWIIDGNYGRTMPLRFASADTIIFLDLSRWVCTWRVVMRAMDGMAQCNERPDITPGCDEEGDWEFFKWVWNFPNDGREVLLRRVEEHGRHAAFHHLRTRAGVREFLRAVTRLSSSKSEATRPEQG